MPEGHIKVSSWALFLLHIWKADIHNPLLCVQISIFHEFFKAEKIYSTTGGTKYSIAFRNFG